MKYKRNDLKLCKVVSVLLCGIRHVSGTTKQHGQCSMHSYITLIVMVRILCGGGTSCKNDEGYIKAYLPWKMDIMGHVIVEVWECNPIFCTNWLTDDNLVDIVELIPVLIPIKQ